MQRAYLFLATLFFVVPTLSFSQLIESFDDGNFTAAPRWEGDTSYFMVNPGLQLQSNGPNAASVLHLATPSACCKNTEWSFYLLLDFDITTSNWAKFYLTSDREDLESFPKGYYVKFDGTSNSVDLYKQDSTTNTKLLAGKPNRAGNKVTNPFRIKVICDSGGQWYLYSDSTGTGNDYYFEGKVRDTSFTSSAYAGIHFTHSSTRRNKLLLDELSIQPAPLMLLSAIATSKNSVDVYFSKALEKFSAETISNYSVSPIISILQAQQDATNPALVHLTLSSSLEQATEYSLSVNSILDKNSNLVLLPNLVSFRYQRPIVSGELLLTEIFADPSPAVGLSEAEYVELYNSTNDTLNLSGVTISDPSTTAILPSYLLPPKQYVAIYLSSNIPLFASYPSTLGVASFPSLNNSGDVLSLRSPANELLHEVDYTDQWYQDNVKKDGGWSLEMIDVNNPCVGEENWIASVHPTGGTPGSVNSVNANKPDITAPVLVKAYLLDSMHIATEWSEKPYAPTLSVNQFILSPNEKINGVAVSNSDKQKIILTTTTQLTPGKTYTLFYSGIQDCKGNTTLQQLSTTILFPDKVTLGDIRINELLFNPVSGGYDFIELYNVSPKHLNLQHWQLANYDHDTISNRKTISSEPLILGPFQYIIFTENKSMIQNYYPLSNFKAIHQLHDLPSFNDDEGTAIVLDSNNRVLDHFDYNESMHYDLIDNKEGVSLERISFLEATNNAENWQSAASTVGYATPGYKNSHAEISMQEKKIWVEPKVITPDNDGSKDFALIHFNLDNTTTMGSITIYDWEGREISKIANNELLSTEGFYQWDGTNEKKEKVNIGLYYVYFDRFDLEGRKERTVLSVAVGWGRP